jgi:hypothetical protein
VALVFIIIIIIIIIIIAGALGVSERAALRASAANVMKLFCFVSPVFVCSVWLHGGQPGCLSIM